MQSNMRMLFLRHAAFSLAMRHQSVATRAHSVDHQHMLWAYVREDNVFLQPLAFDQLKEDVGSSVIPAVVVDSNCKRSGRYADKIFVANAAGAQLLFGGRAYYFDTWYGFAQQMQHYFRWAAAPNHPYSAGGYLFETEGFYTELLKGKKVVERDLHRTEVRYVAGGGQCVHPFYFECTPELSSSRRFKKCPQPCRRRRYCKSK